MLKLPSIIILALTIINSCYNFTPKRVSDTVRLLILHEFNSPCTII